MLVSIIIVSRNTRSLTLDCIRSIFETAACGDFEIVVVDNGSTDGTIDAIKSEYPDVILIENRKNDGFGRANNTGVGRSKGDVLLFLNSDTIAHPGAIKKLVNVFEDDRKVGIAAPRIVGQDGVIQESVAYLIDPSTETSSRARAYARELLKKAASAPEDYADKVYLSGAALAVRREAYEVVSGFDESIFLYFEDADLCKRLVADGWVIRVVTDSEITHFGGCSSSNIHTGAAIEMLRSRIYYIEKHFGSRCAALLSLSYFGNRLKRFIINGICTVLTLGLARKYRNKAVLNGAVCLWFIICRPQREHPIYKKMFCDWQA